MLCMHIIRVCIYTRTVTYITFKSVYTTCVVSTPRTILRGPPRPCWSCCLKLGSFSTGSTGWWEWTGNTIQQANSGCSLVRELRIIYVILLKLVLLNVTKMVRHFNSPHIFSISSLDINHEVMSFKHSSLFQSQSGENNGWGCFEDIFPATFRFKQPWTMPVVKASYTTRWWEVHWKLMTWRCWRVRLESWSIRTELQLRKVNKDTVGNCGIWKR